MTETTEATNGHTSPALAGQLTIVKDAGTLVWCYVLACLPGSAVIGLTLGTSASYPEAGSVGMFEVSEDSGEPTPITRWPAVVTVLRDRFRDIAGDTSELEEQAFQRGRLEGLTAGRDEVQSRWDEWTEMATETAHRYANDNQLCREFDRCMAAIGLPTRSRQYRVTYLVTMPFDETPHGLDAEDLFHAAEDGVSRPYDVTEE